MNTSSQTIKKKFILSGIIAASFPLVIIFFNNIELIRSFLFFFILLYIVYIISYNFSEKNSDNNLLYILIFSFIFRAFIAYTTSIIFKLDETYMPDVRMYHTQMTNIAHSFLNFSRPIIKIHSLGVMTYSYLGSFIYYIFGSSMLLMKLFNSFIGMLLVLNVYRITHLFSNKKTALISSALIAFWPSVAFWASQNLRDSLMVLSISHVIYFFIKGKVSKEKKYFAFIVFPLIGCLLFRYYIGIIITTILLIILLLQLAKVNNYLRIFSYLILITLFGFMLKILMEYIPSIIALFNFRRNYLAAGGSAFLTNVQYSNFGQMLLFIPFGLVYFLFSPFPGSADNIMQLFSSLENIIFYIIFLFAIGGMYKLIKDKKFKLTYFLSIIILSISLFYSVIEANIGTAYRHKMQIVPFIIIFASYYFSKMRIFQSNHNVKE